MGVCYFIFIILYDDGTLFYDDGIFTLQISRLRANAHSFKLICFQRRTRRAY